MTYSIACPGRGADDAGGGAHLDLNELDHGVHPSVRAAVQECLRADAAFVRYAMPHDQVTTRLVAALAERHGVDACNVLLTAGSDAALECIVHVLGDRPVHAFIPTYQYFLHLLAGRRHTTSAGADPPPAGSLVYIADPNNPTGARSSVPLNDPTCVYVVDQAYAEFAQDDHRLSLADNVLYTRTFSKAFGLAGLRVGYVVGPAALLGRLRAAYNEKHVTHVAKVAALQALQCGEHYAAVVDEVRRARADFGRFLDRCGLPYLPSHANFVAFCVGPRAERVVRQLAERGVHVRLRHDMPGYVRATVGSRSSMARLERALAEVLQGLQAP